MGPASSVNIVSLSCFPRSPSRGHARKIPPSPLLSFNGLYSARARCLRNEENISLRIAKFHASSIKPQLRLPRATLTRPLGLHVRCRRLDRAAAAEVQAADAVVGGVAKEYGVQGGEGGGEG